MKTIGPVLSIDNAINSTDGNDTDTFVIFEMTTSNSNLVSQIVMQLWELKSRALNGAGCLGGPRVPLRDGVCHTFQWRLENDEWLSDYEEAFDPRKLIHNFPNELVDEATLAVNSWLANDYAAMNSKSR